MREAVVVHERHAVKHPRSKPAAGRSQLLRHERFAEHDWRPLRSEEHTSELQSLPYLVCRLLLVKKKNAPVRQALEYAASRTPHASRLLSLCRYDDPLSGAKRGYSDGSCPVTCSLIRPTLYAWS